jgi:hypothetical protein
MEANTIFLVRHPVHPELYASPRGWDSLPRAQIFFDREEAHRRAFVSEAFVIARTLAVDDLASRGGLAEPPLAEAC